MLIYVARELSDSFNASDKKYFRSKTKGYDIFFSKLDKFDKKFIQSNIVFGNISPAMLEQSINLEWVQLESAGFSEYMHLEKLNKKIFITNLKGFFAKQVAQTAFASILSIYRGITETNDLKNTKKWIGDPLRNSLSILDKKYVVLLGNGSINKVFKQYIKPFNCKIISFNSNSKNIDINKHLRKAEIVVSALPGTNKTNNFFNKSKLNSLNKNKFLIFLINNLKHKYKAKENLYLPEFTFTDTSKKSFKLKRDIYLHARKRKIIFMGGAIGKRKNLDLWHTWYS